MNNLEKRINNLKIDPRIFNLKFGCRCNGECCHYGVYTDLKEFEGIMAIKDKIIDSMDETQTRDITKWFEIPQKDEDFPSGFAVGTELHNGKCVFLDKKGLCSLQKLALSEGKHQWDYKPVYCVLFPFTVYEETFTIDDEHIDRLGHCNKKPQDDSTIYDSCKDELKHFFGEEGFKELEEFRMEYLLANKSIESEYEFKK
jgi:Fe-S-cluster containining protein